MKLNKTFENLAHDKRVQALLFLLVMLTAALLYNYQHTITYRPTSIHQWRNCVSASMAWNYAHEGEFLHPRTHNLQADELTSDISVTEFPIIYYAIGMLYRIFGTHEVIYRLVQILIGFTGLFFLFRLGMLLFRNILYALIPPLVIFTSPIYVYYINNFIPDAPSLSIVFIAFYFFYRFYLEGRRRDFLFSMGCFALAGLIKTPALLVYFAIIGIFLLEKIFSIKFPGAYHVTGNRDVKEKDYSNQVFSNWRWQVAAMSVVLLTALGWYAYAKIYTDLHGGVVSEVEIRPIWILSSETIRDTWEAIKVRFRGGNYHSPWLLGMVLILWIHNLVFWRRYNRLLSWLTLLTLLGGISFSLLFYRSLRNHDYYQMNNLVITVLVIMNFLVWLKINQAGIYRSILFKFVIAGSMLYLLFSCRNVITEYYYNGWYEHHAREAYNSKYNDITPYLRSLGIGRDDPVYSTPDNSINISLYLMDQKGHTDFFRRDQTFSEKLALFAEAGAEYVILGDLAALGDELSPALMGSMKTDVEMNDDDTGKSPGKYSLQKIGEYNEVQIFRIIETEHAEPREQDLTTASDQKG